MSHRIIALAGSKRVGKDTIAHYLKQHGYENIKLSQTLKDVVKQLFSLTDEQVEGDQKDVVDARWSITPRHALQFFGTEIMQFKIQELLPSIGRCFWVKQLCAHIKAQPSTAKFAISDVRFVHEVEELRRQFPDEVLVVKVVRGAAMEDPHLSEREWQNIKEDVVIDNTSTLNDLFSKVSSQMIS